MLAKKRLEDMKGGRQDQPLTGTKLALALQLLHLCVTHATNHYGAGEGMISQGSATQLATKERQQLIA